MDAGLAGHEPESVQGGAGAVEGEGQAVHRQDWQKEETESGLAERGVPADKILRCAPKRPAHGCAAVKPPALQQRLDCHALVVARVFRHRHWDFAEAVLRQGVGAHHRRRNHYSNGNVSCSLRFAESFLPA